jgi:hypothetical protein
VLITVKAPITVKVTSAKSCVQLANVASNVICAWGSAVEDVNNDVFLDLRKIRVL